MTSESSRRAASGRAFARIELRAGDAGAAERAAAEAFDAGAAGLEEREDETGELRLILYVPAAGAEVLRHRLHARCGAEVRVGPAVAVPDTDWSQAWKAGLEPLEISARLRVRPSFAPAAARPGQAELAIDPGQAFGTGGHESTRLALEWVDALLPELGRGVRVLDVGCGTGVLALAALRLGARAAVACDLDPLAASAARANAAANGLGARLAIFRGSLEALAAARFELVLANLLKRELLPLAAGLAARTAPGGRAVVSGLLESERAEVVEALAAVGLRSVAERGRRDASGERWVALLTRR